MNTNKIKGLMAERGYSQRKLAKEVGVGLNHINEVINNKVSPRLDFVPKLCDILEIDDNAMKSEVFLINLFLIRSN